MPPRGRMPSSRSCGLRKNTVTREPSVMFSAVEPLPRSHRAMCSSSNAIVLPRGVIWANPFGSTVPTRHTWAGKALLICGCRTLGIRAMAALLVAPARGGDEAVGRDADAVRGGIGGKGHRGLRRDGPFLFEQALHLAEAGGVLGKRRRVAAADVEAALLDGDVGEPGALEDRGEVVAVAIGEGARRTRVARPGRAEPPHRDVVGDLPLQILEIG